MKTNETLSSRVEFYLSHKTLSLFVKPISSFAETTHAVRNQLQQLFPVQARRLVIMIILTPPFGVKGSNGGTRKSISTNTCVCGGGFDFILFFFT